MPASEWITEFSALAQIPSGTLRGRHLSAYGARVAEVASDGFWVVDETSHCRVFVVPAEGSLITVSVGQHVDVQGEFRAWRSDDERRHAAAFLYAYTVRPAS
jgi:hypothetical protein